MRQSPKLVALIVAMGIMIALAGRKIVQLQEALDAKPQIVERVVVHEKIVEKRVAGPVSVHEKIVTVNGVKTVERDTERAAVTTDKNVEQDKKSERTETPISRPLHLWTVTGSITPTDMKKNVGLSRSFGIISVGYSHDVGSSMNLKDGHHINLGIPLF